MVQRLCTPREECIMDHTLLTAPVGTYDEPYSVVFTKEDGMPGRFRRATLDAAREIHRVITNGGVDAKMYDINGNEITQ